MNNSVMGLIDDQHLQLTAGHRLNSKRKQVRFWHTWRRSQIARGSAQEKWGRRELEKVCPFPFDY